MPQSGIVTLLYTDLVNSTVHLQRIGDETGADTFQAHHNLISEALSLCGGEEVQWLGDGVLAAFSSTADAVRCAISIEQTARRPIKAAHASRSESAFMWAKCCVARMATSASHS